MLHLYTTSKQLATAWTDHCGEVPLSGGWKPDDMILTECCGKKRKAKNCVVQCYYDGLCVWCADGKGCKHPQAIARKRWNEHMNRSRSQQARRERERAAAAIEKTLDEMDILFLKSLVPDGFIYNPKIRKEKERSELPF